MDFETYRNSFSPALLIGEREENRIAAAYRAGVVSAGGPPSSQVGPLTVTGKYLWDRLERAFELGRRDHA